MKRHSGDFAALALAIGLLVCLQACSEDDATQPPPHHDLSTPTGVADALRNMLADRDTTAIADALAPDVAFVINPFEAETMGWPATITSRELGRSLRNLLTGAVPPAVTAVTVVTWTPAAPFAAADPNSPFPGTQEADYTVKLSLARAGDETLETEGTLRLSVAPLVQDAAVGYTLVGMQEIAAPGGNRTLGGVLVEYLANRPPAVAIAVTPEDGESPHAFAFDASATADPEESAGLEFSWGGDLVGHDWTDWTTVPTTNKTWYRAGTYVVKARARDRWGLVGVDSTECVVTTAGLPFADTADRLLENFAFVYQAMELDQYRDDVLSADYRFILQDHTVEAFQLPDEIYEFADEVAIAEHMFTGRPNGMGRALTDIEVQVLQPQGAWEVVPTDDPYFGAFVGAERRLYSVVLYFDAQGGFRYEVLGSQAFYVTSETVLHEGVLTPRYRLLGQVDLTAALPAGKSTGGASWGDIKALFE